MKAHDNHIAAYYFRKSAMADKAKAVGYNAELVRRLREGLPLTRADKKQARALMRALAERQEPLGPEFEAALFDNLWTLYAR
jgi:TPR repeat protein